MRAVNPLGARTGLDEGAHDVELAEHGGREERRPGAIGEQQLGDFPPPGVGGRPERRLPVAEPPVDGSAGQRRLALDQLPDPGEVAVRDTDHLLGDGWVLAREPVPGRRRDWRRLGREGRWQHGGQAGHGQTEQEAA